MEPQDIEKHWPRENHRGRWLAEEFFRNYQTHRALAFQRSLHLSLLWKYHPKTWHESGQKSIYFPSMD